MMYGSWDIEWKKQMGHFLSFDSPNNQKNQNFEKIKNLLEILSFYTCVPQMETIWCMVPEISNAKDIIFCHFRLFFFRFTHLPLPPPSLTTLENQNFEKIKRTHGDIIILKMSTINKNQKSNDVWFLRCGALQTEFILILDQFLPFYPLPC